jgi:hypothetical protein
MVGTPDPSVISNSRLSRHGSDGEKMKADIFDAAFAALYVGHMIGDHWIQSPGQADVKGEPGWSGRLACAWHVATLTAMVTATLMLTVMATGIHLGLAATTSGLMINALTHYWADRRVTLARLAEKAGKGSFYQLGSPRWGRGDNPNLGTGAYALDQAWHVAGCSSPRLSSVSSLRTLLMSA